MLKVICGHASYGLTITLVSMHAAVLGPITQDAMAKLTKPGMYNATCAVTHAAVWSAGQESDADSGEPELCFNPVSLGKAVEMLPSYLQYEIKFGASQRQTLVGRIMEALGKCKILHKDMQC